MMMRLPCSTFLASLCLSGLLAGNLLASQVEAVAAEPPPSYSRAKPTHSAKIVVIARRGVIPRFRFRFNSKRTDPQKTMGGLVNKSEKESKVNCL